MVEQGESRSHHPLQQLALRLRPSQHTQPQRDTEQESAEIGRIPIRRHRAVGLGCSYGADEEGFDLAEMLRHSRPELRVVRRHFQRGVDQQAAATISLDRALDDLAEKGANRLLGRQR